MGLPDEEFYHQDRPDVKTLETLSEFQKKQLQVLESISIALERIASVLEDRLK